MKVFVKVLWIIAAVALILAGASTFFNPLSAFLTVSYIVGGALVLSGIIGIITYFVGRNVMLGAGWVLADGILSTIFGAMIIFGEYSKDFLAVAIGVMVGMWLLISGVNTLARSFDMHKLGAKGWLWQTLWGLICIAAGVAVFCRPVISAVGIAGMTLGLSLIIGGVAMLFRCLTRDIEI